MVTKVSKWGNSLGLRLPKQLIDQLHLEHGSEVVVAEQDGKIIIEKKEKDMTLDDLLEGMTEAGVMEQYIEVQPIEEERFWENEQ